MSHKPYTPEMKAAVAAWLQEDQQQQDRKEALEPTEDFGSNYDAIRDSMNHRIMERFHDACEDSLSGEVYRFLQHDAVEQQNTKTTIHFTNDAGQIEATVTILVRFRDNETDFKMVAHEGFSKDGKPTMAQSLAMHFIRMLETN